MAARPSILVLSAYYFPFQGGIETHARALATYLASNGFRVAVVTRRVDRESPALERVDGIPVHRVWPPGPRTGLRKWLMIPLAIARMFRLRREFDLIYCPGYQGIGIAAVIAGGLLGRPVVLRSGNIGVLRGDNWNAPLARWRISGDNPVVGWLKRVVQRFYMRADAFVCNSRDIEREALSCQVPRDRVHYLPNAVDIEHFRPPQAGEQARIRSEEGWPVDVFLCLYVGRLSVEKGVLDILEAWRKVRHGHTRLVLVGPDMTASPLDAGPQARAYVSAHGLDEEVVFYGESRDVARLFRAADLYVQPSHYEAFSNSVIEAMATGLPIVASRVGGMLDCIVDEVNGLLATASSPPDIARQMSRVMDDSALAARLGAQARVTAVESFEKEKLFGKFAALFVNTAAAQIQGRT